MEKKLVLIDESTDMYFTNNDERWWSKDISLAYKYNDDADIEHILTCLLHHPCGHPLDGIKWIKLVAIYII